MTPSTDLGASGTSSDRPLPDGGPASPASSPRRAGEPAPPGSADGRARTFRERESKRRSILRDRIGQILVVVIIIVGVYAIVSARPFNPSSGSSSPGPGPPVAVTLGTPLAGNVTCGNGGVAYTERTVVTGSTSPIITGYIAVHVYEILDGDFIPDYLAHPNITATSVCAGSPPSPTNFLWYVALAAPNGTVLLSYTTTLGWKAIGNASWNIPVEAGAALVVVTGTSIDCHGLGLAVVGFAGGSPIRGTIPLCQ